MLQQRQPDKTSISSPLNAHWDMHLEALPTVIHPKLRLIQNIPKSQSLHFFSYTALTSLCLQATVHRRYYKKPN